MHRLMMLSATYRQYVRRPVDRRAREGQRHRSEQQSVLAFRSAADERRRIARQLARRQRADRFQLLAGRTRFRRRKAGRYTQHVPFAGVAETDKRTVYQMTLRNRRPPFMSLFDGPDPNASTAQRQVTTVPTQSLYFMNDPFFHAQAEKVARRVLTQPDDGSRLDELFRIVLQRPPTADERQTATAFLDEYTGRRFPILRRRTSPWPLWSACSRILLSSNQFLYVE